VQTAAIQYGAKDPFVYVLNSDKTVTIKPVIVGVTIGDSTTVTGIMPGQFVVVDGADKSTDGAAVLASNATQLNKVALGTRRWSPLSKTLNNLHWRTLV